MGSLMSMLRRWLSSWQVHSDDVSPESTKDYSYDVFLMHSTEDTEIAKTINDGLTKNGLNCLAKVDDKPFGRLFIESIRRLERESRTSVLVLTKNTVKSPWMTLWIIHALEESRYRGNQLVLRLLLIDVKEDEVPVLKLGCLETLPHFIAKYNEVGWESQLLDSLNKPLNVRDVLPVGSLAHGLVYSHFSGLLSYMLPKKLEKEIRKWDKFNEHKEKTCMNYNMLLPKSCKLHDSLSGKDSGIEIQQTAELKFTKEHMGKPREFIITIYRISRGEEFYFFYADMPFVLNCVYELKEKQLTEGVDTNLQFQRFNHTYITLVNHQDFRRRRNNPLRMLEYDDEKTNHFEVLFDAVKTSVNGPGQTNTTAQQPLNSTVSSPDQVIERPMVCVSCSDDTDDRTIGSKIVKYLKKSKNIIVDTDSDDVGKLASMWKNYNWYVFVISMKSFDDTKYFSKISEILQHSVNKNTAKLILVLHNVDIKRVPDYIQWVTVVCKKDDNYRDYIYQTVIGRPMTMIEKMPCGDVVTGLCWAYLINYLKLALFLRTPDNEGSLDLQGRIKAFLRSNNLSYGCADKVYILWPSSCKMEDDIDIVAHKQLSKEPIVKLASLPPVRANTGGQLNRPFTFSVYKHTRPKTQQSTCFIAEYCTPMGCLYQMATKFAFAGVYKDHLSSQGKDFEKAFTTFTSLPVVKKELGDFQKHTKFLYYDDSEETSLIKVIEEQIIEEQLKQQTNIVFAEDSLDSYVDQFM